MKKFSIVALLLSLLLIVAFPVGIVAGAEELTPTVDAVIDTGAGEPFTWAYLASIAGATAATLLIVQFLKVPLDKVWKIPTRLFVYVIALLIMIIATVFTGGLTIETALLAVVNAFIVALTAYGSYEVTFAKLDKQT